MTAQRTRTVSFFFLGTVLLMALYFAISPAWAVLRQKVELTSDSGEEIPSTSIPFTADTGEEVPIEEDTDEPNIFWLVFPGDNATSGILKIEKEDETIEIVVPLIGFGETLLVDLDARTAAGKPPETSDLTEADNTTESLPSADEILTEIVEIDLQPSEPFDLSLYLEPIEIGPKSEVGTKNAGEKALEGAAGAAIGQLFGGGSRRSSSSRSSEPRTRRDPTRKDDPVNNTDIETETSIGVRPTWTDDGLLISTTIDNSDDKGTFHYVYLVDENGRELAPAKIDIYKLWRKTTLTVSWTRSEYVNGGLVSQTSGGWSKSWTEDLGLFTRKRNGDQGEES